jgi:hypothetical protein
MRHVVVLIAVLGVCGCGLSSGGSGRDAGEDRADRADEAVDVLEEVVPGCGNGVVESGEECDGDPARDCTTLCDSNGSQACRRDCTWDPTCTLPFETRNGRDDDCDGETDEGCGADAGADADADADIDADADAEGCCIPVDCMGNCSTFGLAGLCLHGVCECYH